MLVGGKGLTCVGGKLFSFFRFVLLEMLGVSFSHSGYFFLSRRVFLSLTDLTDLTEPFCAHFEPTEGLRHTENTEASPPTPLRMERGVVCEVTPIGLFAWGVEGFI